MKEDETGRIHGIYNGKRQSFGRKPEGTRPLVRSRCRWQHNRSKKK
jgi:hypothetical protein